MRIIFKILIYLAFLTFAFSTEANIDDIKKIANNFMIENNNKNFIIKEIIKEDLVYIVNFNPAGFVIISSNKNAIPILGYSFTKNINLLNIPIQLDEILNRYNQSIQYIIENNIQTNEKINQLWERYLSGNSYRDNQRIEIAPLITANWNQGGAWNNLCPGNSLVGCVAVAMGQVMYYWRHPEQGSGYSQYYDPDYGVISVVFSDYNYDFDNMNDSNATYDSQLLLYHAGVAVHMNYTPWASGASVCWDGPSAQSGLDENFNYNDDITCEVKLNYSDEEWHELILDQLNRGWPMVYRGYSDDAGHAWNIDGYQNQYFHCNWGWGGSANGYFYFDNLNGGGYNFIDNQAALLNILPDGINSPFALFDYYIDDLYVEFSNLSNLINDDSLVSYSWNFGDGNSSNEISPTHIYNNYGEYAVSLVVTSEFGLDSEQHFEFISILDLTGDINDDNLINILDVVFLVEIILSGPNNAELTLEYSDINEDGGVNIIDVISLVNIILD